MKNRFSFPIVTVSALTVCMLTLITQSGCPQPPPCDCNANANANGNTNGNVNSNTGNSGLTGQFVGSERCMLCHNNIHADWKQTLHGKALESLEAVGQASNAA